MKLALGTLNLPKGFEAHIQSLLGEESSLFFNALEESPPVSVRQNPFKKEKEWHSAEPVLWAKNGKYLAERPVFTTDPFFHAGCYYVQEASSMFLEQFVKENIDLKSTVTALDLCAAPGGKSTHLLSLLNEKSSVFCNEIIAKRNAVLCENITKWGTANVIVTQNESKHFLALQNFFDLIVVDAPCSGEGMFRKDARAVEEWSEKNVELCSVRQAEILQNIIGSLKENGILIYSTCTFEPTENEEKIEWLCREKGFEEIKLQGKLPEGVLASQFGYIFYPHRIKGEGFYMACLRKKICAEQKISDLKSFKKQVQKLTERQVPASLSKVITHLENHAWFIFKNQISFTNPNTLNKLLIAENFLNIKQAGTAVGEEKGKDIVLNHAVAMSIFRNKNLAEIALEKQDALKFLKGESLHIGAEKGWLAIMFQDVCLGWVKSTGERLNNHYPKNWKIRMDIGEF